MLTGNQIAALVTVVVLSIALAAFLRYTRVGIALRASAENADRASLLGIPVKRVQTVAWMAAGVLAAMAIFVQSPLIGVPNDATLGFDSLLYGLAAAVVARIDGPLDLSDTEITAPIMLAGCHFDETVTVANAHLKRLDLAGSHLVGLNARQARIAVTPKGGWVYIVGSTTAPDYPTTPGAFDRTCGTDGACNPVQGRFGIARRADALEETTMTRQH